MAMQDDDDVRLVRELERSDRRERFWGRVGKVIAWGVGLGVAWLWVVTPLFSAPDWAQALGVAILAGGAYVVSALDAMKKQLDAIGRLTHESWERGRPPRY